MSPGYGLQTGGGVDTSYRLFAAAPQKCLNPMQEVIETLKNKSSWGFVMNCEELQRSLRQQSLPGHLSLFIYNWCTSNTIKEK